MQVPGLGLVGVVPKVNGLGKVKQLPDRSFPPRGGRPDRLGQGPAVGDGVPTSGAQVRAHEGSPVEGQDGPGPLGLFTVRGRQ